MAEEEVEYIALMAHVDTKKSEDEKIWFLDSGCLITWVEPRNCFCIFMIINFRQNVKFGDDRKLIVEGKESF